MQATRCVRVLNALIETSQDGSLPWVLLRPRPIDDATAFDGDFDFLIDARQFGGILDAVFAACRNEGVSFIVRRQSTFKRQIELLDPSRGRITLELWPHAELRISAGHGHLTRAAIGYASYRDTPQNDRPSLLAALFIGHLHHKRKDPGADLVGIRIDHFLAQAQLAPELRDALLNLKAGAYSLDQAHACALAYIRARRIAVGSPSRVLAARMLQTARQALAWPTLRSIAVVGPDGSGKSALIDSVRKSPSGKRFRFQRFKRFFRRPLFYWRQSKPRNVRDEELLWLILPVAWVYFSLSRWLTGWRKPVILDRWFYDYFARPMRSEHQPLQRIAAYGLCTALAPTPHRLVIATCSGATVRQRKTEMSEESIERLYTLYVDQVARARIPATLFCHTGISQDQSCRQMREFVDH
jgi:hypothetical protein